MDNAKSSFEFIPNNNGGGRVTYRKELVATIVRQSNGTFVVRERFDKDKNEVFNSRALALGYCLDTNWDSMLGHTISRMRVRYEPHIDPANRPKQRWALS